MGFGHWDLTKGTMKKPFLLSAICYLLFAIVGCGYVTHSALPPGIRVAVPMLKNSTYHSDVETKVTKEIIKKFVTEGTQISSPENADFLLSGELVGYDKKTLRWVGGVKDKIEEYRLTLSVKITYKDLRNNEVIFSETISGDTDYFPDDTESTEAYVIKKDEDTAVQEAAKDLAKNIVDRICEQW